MKRPAVIFLGGAALIICVLLRGLLNPWTDRLPGVDSVNLFTWELYTRAALYDGQLPFWNPYHFAGTPHLADPQTTVLYPPAMLLRWIPPPAFFGWMIALHLWIAAAGAFFAARVVGLGWVAAAAAGVAIMLGGSVPGWVHDGHLLVLYSAVWTPWALALAIVSVRSGRVVPDGRLVAVLVLQFLTGYLQGSLYLAAALGLYFVFSAAWPPVAEATAGRPLAAGDVAEARIPRWKPLAQLALLALLSAGGAAFQLLPTATLISEAGRSVGLVYTEALAGSWNVGDLATLFFPFHQVPDLPVHRFLSDRLTYVGWLLTAFVPFAFLAGERRRISVYFGVVALLVIGLALGDTLGLFRIHHALFPGLRVPGRVLFLATVAIALLGAIGLEAFLTLAAARQWRRIAAGAACSVTAASLATFAVLRAAGALSDPAPGWPWTPLAGAGAVVVVAAAACGGWRRVALVSALAAVVFDVTAVNAGAIATVGTDSPAAIRRQIGPPTSGRALTLCEHRVSAPEFLQNGETSLDGPPSLSLRDYGEWAFIVKSGDVPGRDGFYRRIGSEGELPARRDLLDMANVTRIIACPTGGEGSRDFEVTSNARAWPRAVWVCSAEEVSRQELITRLVQGRYDSDGQLRPRRYLKVRWMPDLADEQRAAITERLRLEGGVWLEGTTWRYALGDSSPDAVLAVIRDPAIEDTHGVDRRTGEPLPQSSVLDAVPDVPGEDGERQMLVGVAPCPAPVRVEVNAMDRADGYVSAHVNAPADGFVFFGEPYYPGRHAYVDGRQVTSARANLAFTAVPVPGGDHHVELRYAATPFYLGSTLSGMTAACYAGLALVRRRRNGR